MADSDAAAVVESASASVQTEDSPSSIPARNVTTLVQGELQAANSEYELLERMNLSEHENQADFTEGLRVFVERLKQQNDRVRDFVFTLSLSELFVLLVWSFCALLYRFCRVCCRVLDGVLGDRLERYAESDADEISWLYFASPELANKVIQALHTHH